jgi:hypothetical protein
MEIAITVANQNVIADDPIIESIETPTTSQQPTAAPDSRSEEDDWPISHNTAELTNKWAPLIEEDPVYKDCRDALLRSDRKFPAQHCLKLSAADCRVRDGLLWYKRRLWVPNHEPTRTGILTQLHDGTLSGHPAIFWRQYFWPSCSADIR